MNDKIKGYKASYNGVCRDQQYEVGQTYNIDNIVMCKRGFHFCLEMNDVLNYYDYNKDFVLFEVIGSGDLITAGDKIVCSQIEIVRIVPKDEYTFHIPLMEYDENNNLIHYKYSTGFEYWQTFDDNNNKIHFKDSHGYEYWNTYDEHNKMIHHKNSDGYEQSYQHIHN